MKKESVNMDKDFREKLSSREIIPSPQAWDRLDAMLNVAEQKEREKPVFRLNYWLVAAAISAVILGIAFFANPEPKQKHELVETPVPVETSSESPVVEEDSVSPKVEVQQKLAPAAAQKYLPEPKSSRLAQVAVAQKEADVRKEISPIDNVVIQPEAEIQAEQLLAQNDQPDAKPKRIQIDASSLLSEVDGELEHSFRERVLNSIDQKFKKARTAVANRNQQ